MKFDLLNKEEKEVALLVMQGYTAENIAEHKRNSTAYILGIIDKIVRKIGPRPLTKPK